MPDIDPAPPAFALTTLGRLELRREGTPVMGRRRKELALLAYLARRAPRPVDRVVAASLLWGDRDDRKARVSLRQALFELKALLGDRIAASSETIRLDPGAVELDATEFEVEVARGDLTTAADRWQGDFLAGLEDLGDDRWSDWLEGERAALTARLLAALDGLGSRAEGAANWAEVVRWAERHLEVAPYQEHVAVRLVRAYRAVGRPDEAAAAIARFSDRLRRDLDAGPSSAFAAAVAAPSLSPGPIGRPGLRGLVSPDLVGRERELGAARRAWDDVARGAGRVIVIDGTQGIGKTRLMGEIEAALQAMHPSGVVASTRAFDAEREVDWSAIRPLFSTIVRFAKGLVAAPPETLAAAAAIIPALAERFSQRVGPSPGDDAVAALTRLVAEAAAEQPVALMLDDAFEADPASARVLGELVRRPPGGLLLVLATRPDPRADLPLARDLGRETAWTTRMPLAPFDEAECERAIASMAPWAPDGAARLARVVAPATGGVPALVVAAVQELAETGAIGPDTTGAWEAREDLTVARVSGSGTLRDHVRSMLGGLTPAARRLFEIAAAMGPAVDGAVLEAVSDLEPAAFRRAADELLAARQLREARGRAGQFECPSEAIRVAVHDGLAPSARRALHSRLVGASRAAGATPTEVSRHEALAGGRGRSLRWRWAVAAALMLVAGLGWWAGQPAAPRQAGTGVLLATPEIGSVDSSFTGLLPVVVRAAIERSGYLWIAAPNQVSDALQRMQRPADTVLRGELAREVALRENLPAILSISVAKPGTAFVMTARLTAAETGRDLAARTVRFAGGDEVVNAVNTIVAGLLRDLGDRPAVTDSLPALTTRSLAALRWFALGELSWNRRDYEATRVHWQRAIAEDSAFAMAHVMMGRFEVFPGNNRPAAMAHYDAAERFAERLTERERLEMKLGRARLMGQAFLARTTAAALAERFPSPVTISSYGSALFQDGLCAEAIPVFRQAIALRPTNAANWINLATCYQVVDSTSAAVAAYLAADRIDSTALYRDHLNQEWVRALLVAGRAEAAESVARKMTLGPGLPRGARGYRTRAYLAITRGRLADAAEALERSTESYRAANFSGYSVFRNRLLRAQIEAARGDAREAERQLAKARELEGAVSSGAQAWVAAALSALVVGDRATAVRWLDRLTATMLVTDRGDSAGYRLVRGALALEGRPAETLRWLEVPPPRSLPQFAGAHWLLRGRAHLALGAPDSALAAFREAAAHRTWGNELQLEWERVPRYLAEAALAAGDSALARASLSELLTRWRPGDTTGREWRQVRARLTELQRSVSR